MHPSLSPCHAPIPVPMPCTHPCPHAIILEIAGLTATNQIFGEVTKLPDKDFFDDRFDGILGMAWPAIAVDNVAPVFNTLVTLGVVTKPVFGFYLDRWVWYGCGHPTCKRCF